MNQEDRINLLTSKLTTALQRAKEGHSTFLIITEKSTGKYVQVSTIAGENEIVIDAPEGVFEPNQLEKIELCFKKKGIKHKAAIGISIWIEEPEKAVEAIDCIFKNALDLDDTYDIEIEGFI